MCNTWKCPSDKKREIAAEDLHSFPSVNRLNITGGEPFLRDDLGAILDVVRKKARRVVISTNGFATKKILEVMKDRKDVGVRISFDGIGATHDLVRGVEKAHRRALESLRELKKIGIKDLGIAVTISDKNAHDLVPLFRLAAEHNVELATAILHNAYYFHKEDNVISDKPRVEKEIKKLMREYLTSFHPKDWFRAYFTKGLVEHLSGAKRELQCTMASDSFFIDPYGDVRPCNVMNFPFGNIKEKTFAEIWSSPEAEEARKRVSGCDQNCWMIGSVGHLMRKKMWVPVLWIARHKWRGAGEVSACAS
jgi:MoaA/NifB/PqqE/SkfB family radical SAM enzyme